MISVGDEIEDLYILSPMQQGLLLEALARPEASVEVWQMVLDLRERVEASAFERAWQRLAARHPMLRTRFRWQGLAEPVQEVLRHSDLPLEHHDWSHLSAAGQEEAFQDFLTADRRRGLDPTVAPLLRVALIRLAEERYRSVVTIHHAIADGRSALMLLNELFAFYEAFCRGEDAELPAPRGFRAYVDWLAAQDLERAEHFWRQSLRGVTEPTAMVVDRPSTRSPGEGQTETAAAREPHAEVELRLSEELTGALTALSKAHGLTLNTLLQGAWALLLSRYNQSSEVLFGVVRTSRPVVERGDSIFGPMINSVPFHASLAGDPLLLPWLQGLRDHWLAMRVADHVSPMKIREWSELPAGSALYESVLLFERFELSALLRRQGGGWLKRDVHMVRQPDLPLAVYGFEGKRFLLKVIYDRARFEGVAVARMLGHLASLLSAMPAGLDARAADLPLLTGGEQAQLLAEWNDTAAGGPDGADAFLHHTFEGFAARQPQAPAVVSAEGAVTYDELNRRANQLAHWLRSSGVVHEARVGVCAERSVDLAVSFLGILKAGGAYVPLAPALPPERLAVLIEDSETTVVVTQSSLLARLPARRPPTLCLDAPGSLAGWPEDNPGPVGLQQESLSYLIFTSGSTGRPKGVMLHHQGLSNAVRVQTAAFGRAGGRVLQAASISFDASVFEMAMALGTGAALCPGEESPLAGPPLLDVLRSRRVTFFLLTPSAFASVAAADLPDLETISVGGEACPQELVEQWARKRPFFNLYGPTEVTIFATMARGVAGEAVTIGRPVAGFEVYLLDRELRPVAVGIPGDLYVGGLGLARGYAGRPDLTAASFLPNPFARGRGERLYRTGDLARFLADGRIEFLGRCDHQVKVRGFRIEPGEVEAVLCRHDGVRQAAVLALDAAAGGQLAAFFVPARQPAPTAHELRQWLEARLPDYMVPARLVEVDEIPLTVNGKLDRRRLAEQAGTAAAPVGPDLVLPRGPIEEWLAQVWSHVLGVSRIGAHSSFFELGGHSLAAIQVLSRLEESFGVRIPMRTLLETPVLSEMAARIVAARREGEGVTAPIAPAPRAGELPLSYGQQRLWFLHQLEPESPRYNVVRFYDLRGSLALAPLRRALDGIVERHEILRTRFPKVEGRGVQRIDPICPAALLVVDLSGLPAGGAAREVERLTREESRAPFDLGRDRLLRLTLLRLGEREHRLLVSLHHIVADAWSMEVLFHELRLLYTACVAGEALSLTPLPIQYADYAAWQRRQLGGPELADQIAFWRQRLAGVPQLELPLDHPRPPVQSLRGSRRSARLPAGLSAGIKALAWRRHATPFMAFLAAVAILLRRYAGQEDLAIGTPVANRDRAELEGLIGFFVNTLVLRLDLGGNPDFPALLARVREACLAAYTHQDVPFDLLVDQLRPERAVSHNPLFQVMFAFQPQDFTALELPGLEAEPRAADTGAAHFDLIYSIEDGAAGLDLTLGYAADLFRAATMARQLGHFEALLAGIVAAPETGCLDLPWLRAAERHQLLAEWNDTRSEAGAGELVHQLFAAHARRAPEAPALCWEEGALTYGELERRANQLAHALRRLGVGPEVRVALCLLRGPHLAWAALAVLKAGGAYVPCDPDTPRERLRYLLADAGALLVLTEEPLLGRLEPGIQALCLDREASLLAGEPPDALAATVDGGNLAYVIYTSGSTGQPKGVELCHAGLANLAAWHREAYGLGPADRATQVARVGFDASVWEIWPYLTAGASLAYPPAETVASPSALVGWLAGQGITHTFVPTPLAEVMLQKEWPAAAPLRALLTGGDRLHLGPPAGFSPALMNHYGPTESTVVATWGRADEPSPAIGRPIANLRLLLLDPASLAPVPVGVPGEICLGGAGLARGYRGRPEQTAESFVPDPFAEPAGRGGERLYRTGDLARWRTDGRVEFIGRRDHQVKIRGFRIELGEIETALREHPSVQEVVVLAPETAVGERGLAACVVLRPGAAATDPDADPGATLRAFLRDKLPSYMVPAAFVVLPELPLTANGKVDRARLALPREVLAGGAAALGAHAPLTTDMERTVARIWSEVLGVSRVGSDDNFFDLGGHSLTLVEVHERLQKEVGAAPPLVELFELTTVRSLAARLEEPVAPRGPIAVTAPDDVHQRAARQRQAIARRRGVLAGGRA